MGRHVSGDVPELDRLVDDACAEMGREIDSLSIPRLAGVVLGGGSGRGEGGVRECKVEGAKCKVEEGRGKREERVPDVDCRTTWTSLRLRRTACRRRRPLRQSVLL